MADEGYYHNPTLFGERVVFVCEDDLWEVPADGGVARRLTANPGRVLNAAFSPDGETLAFTGRDEGDSEVYVMLAAGGAAERLTYLGGDAQMVGWTPDGKVVFASNAAAPFSRLFKLYTVPATGGEPAELPTGPASSLSYGSSGGRVIARNTTDLARWKRYRGGLTGDVWIDVEGDGDWKRLLEPGGNVASPLWVGERIYFVSDHEGVGNLYSRTPEGDDERRHTHHADYYVRHPATDGRHIVYQAGADLYLFDPEEDKSRPIEVVFHSPRAQRKRKFVEAAAYLEDYTLDPEGRTVALTTRGQAFSVGLWEGAALRYGENEGVRYRLPTYLHDGTRLALISDAGGEDALELHTADTLEEPARFALELGRPLTMTASPTEDKLALTNHRYELVLVDVSAGTATVIDSSTHAPIQGVAWSPDGRWLAYGFHDTFETSLIKLCRVDTGETFAVTRPVLWDGFPAFDPAGRYLYFLSYRNFNPVYDSIGFNLGFPKGGRPFLITLQANTLSPFARTLEADKEEKDKAGEEDKTPLRIDLGGITDRLVAFPVPEGRYTQVRGLKNKVLFSSLPVEGALETDWFSFGPPPAKAKLEVYDFAEQKLETLVEGVTDFEVSGNAEKLIYRAGDRLRVLAAGEKPNDEEEPGRKSGWLELGRVKVSVTPPAEWAQIYRDAWRRQRDHFWTADMSGVDWEGVYARYLPLLERVGTRAEFSDLLWEMQGELGTSHAYEFGGDYREEPSYPQGFLGADLAYDAESEGYLVQHIVRGDVWDEKSGSPLLRPGVNVRVGDRLLAVNGRRVSKDVPPATLLVHQAESEVVLTFAPADGGAPRTVTVKTLRDERPARYRDWVERNRAFVHEASDGRVGYIHIPDMGPQGFAEFHRAFFAEVNREGLLIDVRWNGGGHVSGLLLERLARRRLGYSVPRRGEPQPYPDLSPMGPMVALTNEQAGSDGDIFSHAFKMMGLGPLLGKRTWGGVVGINVTGQLLDGSVTTQPEFSFWFKDVGWGVENYGADPDIEVDLRPQDDVAGRDAQLERAVEELGRLLQTPPQRPDFGERPDLAPPPLPEPSV